MRIVSLLPSTTEILFAIGAGDDVVGVTFECDHPAEARTRTIVSTSALPPGLSSAEIDAFVVAALHRGEDLYHLDEGALAGLDPDLVVTQDLCAVCAVDVSVVDDALAHLGCTAEVLTIDPHTLDEVLESILVLGRATGHEPAAAALVADLRARLDAVAAGSRVVPRPRVMLLEWTDPPFAPGHWIPEMVDRSPAATPSSAAPARSRAGSPGTRSTAAEPEVVVVAPCGYDLDGAEALAVDVRTRFPDLPVHAVDANASWARPGTRLVDGIEHLATLLHG